MGSDSSTTGRTRHRMKQGDLLPVLEVQLTDGGTPIDLTNAASLTFVMRSRAAVLVHAAMSRADQATYPGVARYEWAPGDTDQVGSFDAEIRVVWPDGKPQTFPASAYFGVEIAKRLDPTP